MGTDSPNNDPIMFCSWRARQSGSQLNGTATQATSWLLIEVPSAWGANALADSDLPDAVKARCSEWTDAVDGLRVQFIRREVNAPDEDGTTRVFVATSGLQSARLYRTRVDDVSTLADLDVESVVDESPSDRWTTMMGSLVLTCTNGKRDRCCARWGRPLAAAFDEAAGDASWQTSHLGGHRFAPTCLLLPKGIQYGWIAADEAGALWTTHAGGHVYRLDRYRGHTGYARPVQAAETYLREMTGCKTLDAIAFHRATQKGDTWRVRLDYDGERHEVRLTEQASEPMQLSCGADPKTTSRFQLEGHRTL